MRGYITWITTVCCWASVPASSADIKIEFPEAELRKIENELTMTDKELNSVIRLQKNRNLYINRVAAAKTLAQAKKLLKMGHFRAARSFFLQFLQEVQSPENKDLTDTRVGLFYIYINQREFAKASAEVSRYVQVFLSDQKKDYDEFTDVLKSIVSHFPLQSRNYSGLKKFLAALRTIHYPKEYRYEITYLLAYLAKREGLTQLASQWLANASVLSDSREIKSKTLFYQGIIALRMNKISQAANLFEAAVLKEGEKSLRNYANLALGRIWFYKGEQNRAIEYYHQIPDDSPLYVPALFELSLLSASLGKWRDAHSYGVNFLADTQAEDQKTARFAGFIPFLELQAGQLGQAGSSLEQRIKNMEKLSKDVTGFRVKDHESPSESLNRLHGLIRGKVATPPLLGKMLKVARYLSHLEQKHDALHGYILNFIIAFGRARIEDLNSQGHNRYLQMVRIAHRLLFLAERLSVAEFMVLEKSMSQEEKTTLNLLAVRRKNLLREKMNFYRSHPYFSSERNLWKSTGSLARVFNKLYKADAIFSSSRYLSALKGKSKASVLQHRKDMNDRSETLHRDLDRHLGLIRVARIKSQIRSYESNKEKKLIGDFSDTLTEESRIFSSVRNRSRVLNARDTAAEFESSWKHWQLLMEAIDQRSREEEREIVGATKNLLQDLTMYRHEEKLILDGIKEKKSDLNKIVHDGVDYVRSHLKHAISEQSSRYHKWLADASWKKYDKMQKLHQSDVGDFQAEKKSLNMYIEQIKRGILEPWPNPVP